MNKITRLFTGGVLVLASASNAHAEYGLNMTRGVTRLSRDVYDLHMLIFWIVVAIGVAVFGIMFYSIYHHRKSRGAVAANFHESAKVEIVWTVIPFIILISMAIPATSTLIDMEDTSESDLSIKVTGYQWKWKYEYLGDDIKFFSKLDTKSNQARQRGSNINPADVRNYLLNVDNPLVVPVNKKIRFLFTAADVLHAWWVPDLGWKKDTVPGFINEAWARIEKPGTYRGQCAELCGRDHGFMPIVVKAISPEDFEAWKEAWQNQHGSTSTTKQALIAKEWTMDELMARGGKVYSENCAACHQSGGEGVSGAFPALSGSSVVNGPIEEQVEIVTKGKGGVMPSFGGDMLGPGDIAAVITYTRNALGNEVGDMIQPSALVPAESKDEDDVMSQGSQVYADHCAACHMENGEGVPGNFPAIAGSPIATGEKSRHIETVLKGKGEMMPAFGGGKMLSEEEIAAVITYQRNSFGNATGDTVTPDEVKAYQ